MTSDMDIGKKVARLFGGKIFFHNQRAPEIPRDEIDRLLETSGLPITSQELLNKMHPYRRSGSVESCHLFVKITYGDEPERYRMLRCQIETNPFKY